VTVQTDCSQLMLALSPIWIEQVLLPLQSALHDD
jgi:hypothetical protein